MTRSIYKHCGLILIVSLLILCFYKYANFLTHCNVYYGNVKEFGIWANKASEDLTSCSYYVLIKNNLDYEVRLMSVSLSYQTKPNTTFIGNKGYPIKIEAKPYNKYDLSLSPDEDILLSATIPKNSNLELDQRIDNNTLKVEINAVNLDDKEHPSLTFIDSVPLIL